MKPGQLKSKLQRTLAVYHGVVVVAVLFSRCAAAANILNLRSIEDRGDDVDNLHFLDILARVSRDKENSLNIQNIRRNEMTKTQKAQALFNAFKQIMDTNDMKKSLRYGRAHQGTKGGGFVDKEITELVERELQNALAKQSSAMLDRPYIQAAGKNEFLVLKSAVQDPFVTVVPNDIYYYKEKKCVNWLEDCNEQGIRGRMLQRVKD